LITNISETIQTGMGGLMTAVGVAGVLAPDRLNASGSGGTTTAEAAYLTRLWALRESALGLMLLGTRNSSHRRGVLAVTVGLAVAEIVVGLRSPVLTGRNRSSTVGTAAVFAAAGACGLVLDR
jgi:hypothetical protein